MQNASLGQIIPKKENNFTGKNPFSTGATALDTLHFLGIPVAANKTEGPTTQLLFLGIFIDTHRSELRLPSDKLANLIALLYYDTIQVQGSAVPTRVHMALQYIT